MYFELLNFSFEILIIIEQSLKVIDNKKLKQISRIVFS